MSRETFFGDIQQAFSSRRLATGAGLLAAAAAISSCSDREVAPVAVDGLSDKPTALTLQDMGADAGVPDIFSCGIECLSPEDRAAYDARQAFEYGLAPVLGPERIIPLPPLCGCGGSHTEEESVVDVSTLH